LHIPRYLRASFPAALPVLAIAAGPAADLAPPGEAAPRPSAFRLLEDRYIGEFMKRNPVKATYLGGDAYRADLADVSSTLRDYSPVALRDEDAALVALLGKLLALDRSALPPEESVNAAVMESQIGFMHNLIADRRYQLRCLDTYMVEPFRGVDWQLQGMTASADGGYGSREEWERVARRTARIPDYLAIAKANLKAGVAAGIVPDWRMIEKDGLGSAAANADYFDRTLVKLFEERTKGGSFAPDLLPALKKAAAAAAAAYRDMRTFILDTYYTKEGAKALSGPGEIPGAGLFRTHDLLKPEFGRDNYAFGEAAYARAVRANLRITKPVAALYDQADAWVRSTQAALIGAAKRVDAAKGWGLPWGDEAKDNASTRAVLSRLGEEAPGDDDEMIAWYRKKALDLVAYGRKYSLFDIPAGYTLEIVQTPPALLSSIDGASYFPAPIFKPGGEGRLYLTPTGNDPALLRQHNQSALADLCAHEGFPGHDWDFRFLRARAGSIEKIRWLTPGAVEDSSAMWEDSMRLEGWALYGEELMGEAREGAPDGLYTPEERIFQLQGLLLRDARVRVDIGIHTGRMSFEKAVDYVTTSVDLIPGACGSREPEARAACETATKAIFRYSKWPTQAITYRMGKQEILDLRAEVKSIQGERFDLRAFHEQVLGSGPIPLAYVRARILDWARSASRGTE